MKLRSLLRQTTGFVLALLFVASLHSAASAPLPLLSPIFGEHMVLQRNRPVPLWGWAAPGTEITVTFAGQSPRTTADSSGRWQLTLAALSSSATPQELTLTAANRNSKIENQKISDVLVGDVWLCSGQSNMEWPLHRARDGEREIEQATQPLVRLFRVPNHPAYAAESVPGGEWRRCEPAAFRQPGGFSAVAYFFARRLATETGVPVGLVQAAVGGTPAESWMSPAALGAFPDFSAGLAEMERLRARGGAVYGNFVMHWYDEFDRGVAGHWHESAFATADWKTVSLKTAFADLGVAATPAVVWLRREVVLPDPLPPGAAKLRLGIVEKMDTAWIDGRWIGASAWVENPRAYDIPAGTLHPGRNVIALRVLKTAPDGGFRSAPEDLRLTIGDASFPLEGEWHAALGVDARAPHPLPLGYDNWPTMPAVLQLGMVRPLAPLALAGALWYQGESNTARAAQYRTLLPALIADWRRLFAHDALPFYIVQLPAFMDRRAAPGPDGWAELRDAQARTAATVPHTGLAVMIDTGDAKDIHPTDKIPVGERLAALVLHDVHGRTTTGRGPLYSHVEKLPGALRVHFTHVDGGLVTRGETLGEFSVAGADRVWHWATARIEGDTVVVTAPEVPTPVAVRFAWQANPLATLFNPAGLPAAPFRSDDW